MRGCGPIQTGLQRGIENRGFNQIKNILRKITPQITLYYFSEKKSLLLWIKMFHCFSGFSHQGCKFAQDYTTFPRLLVNLGEAVDTVRLCYIAARKRGFRFFGVRNNTDCVAGNNSHSLNQTSKCKNGNETDIYSISNGKSTDLLI